MIYSIEANLVLNHGEKEEKNKKIKMHCETVGSDEILLMSENDKKVKFKFKAEDLKEMLKYLG